MAARQVLNGNFDFDMITDTSVSTILKHMKQQNARQRHAIRPEISLSSFISKLKTWREYTATSPSGLHLGHYRSLIARHSYSERDPEDQDKQRLDRMQSELRLLHLRLINYALTRGYSYKRWQQVVNSMLWKEPGNHKIHRTRVIHLFEADYNLALNLKWREASLQAERNGLLYKGQYGSRPRKCAVDPVLLEVLQTEMSRITRKSLVLMNFDATSCYDRILPSLANLASRKFGVPPTVTQMNVLTLEKTSYQLRTGIGMSPTGYSHCEENPIYGIGQGAGHAAQTWNFISSVLLEYHEEQVEGAKYEFPDRSAKLALPMVRFVDDNNGQCNQFLSDEPVLAEILATQATSEIKTWKSFLRASGGALELPKCTYQILSWGFTMAGGPILRGGTTGPEICVEDADNPGHMLKIPQLSAHAAHKTLGHYLKPAGTNKKQLEILKEKSDEIATTLMASGLSRSETWTYYFSTYLPSL